MLGHFKEYSILVDFLVKTFSLKKRKDNKPNHKQRTIDLQPTRSEGREVFVLGSNPVAILLSRQDMKSVAL